MASSTTDNDRTSVRGIGEIALRVNNLDSMQKFYEEVLGLPLMTRVPSAAFFKIADGYAGHTQVLALFDRFGTHGYRRSDAATSTVDHIAFEIGRADLANDEAGSIRAPSRNSGARMVALALPLCDRSRGQSGGVGLLRRACLARSAPAQFIW